MATSTLFSFDDTDDDQRPTDPGAPALAGETARGMSETFGLPVLTTFGICEVTAVDERR